MLVHDLTQDDVTVGRANRRRCGVWKWLFVRLFGQFKEQVQDGFYIGVYEYRGKKYLFDAVSQ